MPASSEVFVRPAGPRRVPAAAAAVLALLAAGWVAAIAGGVSSPSPLPRLRRPALFAARPPARVPPAPHQLVGAVSVRPRTDFEVSS